jgi:hypothetical protein
MNTTELGTTLVVQARVNPAKERALMDQIAAEAGRGEERRGEERRGEERTASLC